MTRKRGRRGAVSIVPNESGSCTLRYTFKRKRYQETVALEEASIRKAEIELEIQKGIHVPTKFKEFKKQLTLTEAWDEYRDLKQKTTTPETFKRNYTPIHNHFQKCPYKTLDEAQQVIKYFEQHCTTGVARRVLMHLSACCREFCDRNPFDGEYRRFKDKYQENPSPRMLTDEEIEAGLAAMNERGVKLVRFMLLTGCRPGEALGLHHEDVRKGMIRFHQTLKEDAGRAYITEGLKTQKERYFPINEKLNAFLKTLKGDGLVFRSTTDGPMSLNNFRYRQWNKHFPEDTTPYNCRDTFITDQLIKGVSSSVVAAWVGNSAAVIEKHYLDKVKLGLSQMPK